MTAGLFNLAWILGVGSWIFTAIEMISVHSFIKFFFYIGIPIYRQKIDLPSTYQPPEIEEVIKKSEGKFCYMPNRRFYFLSQMFWFKFRINTPFPLRAIGTITAGNQLNIVARLPLGTTLFFIFWIIGWTVASIGASTSEGNYAVVVFGLIGWFFAGLIFAISYPIELDRMRKMTKELQQIINEQESFRDY
jgi:hypothetical protein